MNEYSEFKEELRSLIREEIKSFLQEEGFYRCIPGEVTKIDSDKASVDTVTTVVSDLLNKTGEELQTGDSVLLMEKYGSNYSNSFVLAKNGDNRNNTSSRISENEKSLSEVKTKVATLEKNVTELTDEAVTSTNVNTIEIKNKIVYINNNYYVAVNS